MKDTTTLEFINHASVIISHGEVSLLSDPWYQGDAFHKGWNLMHEFSDIKFQGILYNFVLKKWNYINTEKVNYLFTSKFQ